jgi:uncharacterized protein with von Willebrand factor type A (vWA) domain
VSEPVLVEPAALAAGLARALHRAGVPVDVERAGRLATALRLLPSIDRDGLYWTARVTLMSSRDQLPVFDAVFAAVFDGLLDPADARGDPTAPPLVGAEPTGRRDGARRRERSSPVDAPAAPGAASPGGAPPAETGATREAVLAAASPAERLSATSFADLSEAELREVRQLVARLQLATPVRRTRRSRASSRPAERIDLRRTLRRAQRSGGDPVRLVHRRRRVQRRRLVLLCDVSGSMETYTRVYLALLQGAVAGARGEAFVFSTRLTRLTRELATRDPDQALARAAQAAPDWSGGTRLAASLRTFLDRHGRRGLARGAVVVVLSDGWATDDPSDVARQMARLRRLAYRIVWVNPRKAAPAFRPLAGGMSAALPFCDAFVSGHSLAALEEVAGAVSDSR